MGPAAAALAALIDDPMFAKSVAAANHLRRRNHKRHPAPPTSSAQLHESQTCDTVGRAFDPITIWKQDVALSLKELPPTRSSARTCCAKVVGAETNRRAPLPAPPP